MKASIAYQQISLPETPLSSPSPLRQISYSRHLEANRRVQTANSNFFHQSQDQEAFHAVDAWNKEVVRSPQVKKDDMLKVLKGKNYMLTSHQKSKLVIQTHGSTHKKIYRSLIKDSRASPQGKCNEKSNFSPISLKRRRKESKASNERQNQVMNREKLFLRRELRMEKWIKAGPQKVL